MDISLIGFVGTLFALFTIINNMMGGALIKSGDVAHFQSIVMFSNLNVGGLLVPLPNIGYLNGLMHLVQFDNSFFGGNAAMIQYLLYSMSGAVAFVLFIVFAGITFSAVTRVLR